MPKIAFRSIYNFLSIVIFLIASLATSHSVFAKDIRYVSDELTIPMRSGTTTNHKILKFLNSGMAVQVIEESPDKNYIKVELIEDTSKSGWVESRLLMIEPSAREQLVRVKEANQALKKQRSDLKNQLSESKQTSADLMKVQTQLEQRIVELETRLSSLRSSAAEPIRLAEENMQLKQQLASEQQKNDELIEQNAFLADHNIKQWFMIGAAVSIGSLLLGLLITRINWRKRDSWGGSF